MAQSEMQARTSLHGLEQLVNIVSRAPGQRSIVLVSPGFLSQSGQYQLDRIIDRALRSQVVISSLDPKGLAILMRESDASQSYAPLQARLQPRTAWILQEKQLPPRCWRRLHMAPGANSFTTTTT